MKINKKDRLILHALKWIIERDNWAPHIRKEMNEDICKSITDFISPNVQIANKGGKDEK